MSILKNVWRSDLKIRIAILEKAKEKFGDVNLSEVIRKYEEFLEEHKCHS